MIKWSKSQLRHWLDINGWEIVYENGKHWHVRKKRGYVSADIIVTAHRDGSMADYEVV